MADLAQPAIPPGVEDPCSDYSYMVQQAATNVMAGLYRNQLRAAGAPQSQIDNILDASTGRPGPTIPILADNTPLALYLQSWIQQAIADPSIMQGLNPTIAAANAARAFCTGTAGAPGAAPSSTAYPFFSAATTIGVPPADLASLNVTQQPAAVTTPAPVTTPDTTATATTPVTAATVATAATPQPRFIAGGAVGIGTVGAIGSLAAGALTFGISIVATIIGSLFSGLFGGSDVKALQQAVEALRQAMAQMGDELERFSWSVAFALGQTWQAIANIWDNFLDALWTYMKQLWNLLWVLVSQVLPKLINVVRDLRKFLDSIYVKYILPAMKYLQLVRQVLAILRALHIPIAAKLDKILGEIQAALYVPLLGLARIVGGYGAWINTILTNRYLIQQPVFLRTMWAYQSDWINIFWAAQTLGQGNTVQNTGPGAGALVANTAAVDAVKQYVATSTGPMAADVANAKAMIAATMAGNV